MRHPAPATVPTPLPGRMRASLLGAWHQPAQPGRADGSPATLRRSLATLVTSVHISIPVAEYAAIAGLCVVLALAATLTPAAVMLRATPRQSRTAQ